MKIFLRLLGFKWIVSEQNDPGFKLGLCQFYYFKWDDIVLIYYPWSKDKMKYRLANRRELSAGIKY